jgi:hypothetical protein
MTKSTITEYSEIILPASPPQTIQDVVAVTRGLGFHFNYIDALYIIQDSDADKDREIN